MILSSGCPPWQPDHPRTRRGPALLHHASGHDQREAVGYNHMCLEVADIDVALRELEAAGVPPIRDKQMGADGNWQAWIEDPDGHRIELMQMMPDSLQAKADRPPLGGPG